RRDPAVGPRTMPYAYACFISYKRPPKRTVPAEDVAPARPPKPHIWLQFAEAFQIQLDQFLTTHERSFRDDALAPGTDYPRGLAKNLCRSRCMVALVVPEYF